MSEQIENSSTIRKFSRDWLNIDVQAETNKIIELLRHNIFELFHKQGAVVGISGGIDSSVVLALSVKALGADKVLGVLMPEVESSPESAYLAQSLADSFGVQTILEPVSDVLEGFGCYRRRDEAIKKVIPEYQQPGWTAKIVLPTNLLDKSILNLFRLVATSPEKQEYSMRLPKNEYQQIVAASNFKQRSRMSILYYHAEAHNLAVIGTANKNEHDLGFFVKYGDGGADICPIRHLFKSQIYQLAQYLGIPDDIRKRTPTTDTYPGGCTQEEFFYRVPFEILDTVWLGYEKGVHADEIAAALNLQPDQVLRVISDIQSKIRGTNYLRLPPITLDGSS